MIQSPVYWAVFAGAVVVFWLIPKGVRYGFLALASFGVLLPLEPAGVIVLTGWSLLFYLLAPRTVVPVPIRRWIGPALIVGILGYLAYFKYIPPLVAALTSDPIEGQLVIPLGISYFTFKLIHYAIEVGRGNIQNRSVQQFFCYIFLFPIFSAGPIERFDHFLANQDNRPSIRALVEGLTRIIHGLIKKFVIAAFLSEQVGRLGAAGAEALLRDLSGLPTYWAWGYCGMTFLYVYMDFSAYSDIAIGSSRLFGIRIMENFNWPIFAQNIGDFWRRWHMTLAGWCQTYVYLPTIGLSRNPFLAVYATFLAIGLWHAGSINYACWGLYHAMGVAVFQIWQRFKRRRGWAFLDRNPWRLPGIPITFLFVTGSFAFTVPHGAGTAYDALRIFLKLLFINLPVGT